MILIGGAGISGLSLAFFLQQQGREFLLIDPADHVGGKIKTISRDGFLMDVGPNSLLADEEVMNFLADAGLSDDIEYPEAISSKRFIFRNGHFHGLSQHPLSLLFTRLLTLKGKLRILRERWIPPAPDQDETLESFVRRRFGAEALDWLASPVQYGIHAADPAKLLVADAFPALWKMELESGSVLKGLSGSRSGSRPKTLNFKGGMQALTHRLAALLKENIRLKTRLINLEKTESGWNCNIDSPEGTLRQNFESVIFCMPASEAARVLQNSGLKAAEALSSVRYNPMTVTHMAFKKTAPDEFKGFGGLVPAAANFKTAGAIWTSSVFKHRQPQDFHLLAAFYGGALRPESASLTKEETESVFKKENAILYGRSADYILNVEQWKEGIPQYDKARRNAENAIKELSSQRLYFLSNWKGGIGLSDCIRNAARLAENLKMPD